MTFTRYWPRGSRHLHWPASPFRRARFVRTVGAVASGCAVLALALCAPGGSLPALAEAPRWSWPVASPHHIERPYLAPATPYGTGHRGIDIAAGEGAQIRAPAGGTVAYVGVVVDRAVITIDHGGGWKSSYEPVSPADASLGVGTQLAEGEVFGVRSRSHGTCGACIHLGVRLHGEYVSPLLLLSSPAPSVLLPMDGGWPT